MFQFQYKPKGAADKPDSSEAADEKPNPTLYDARSISYGNLPDSRVSAESAASDESDDDQPPALPRATELLAAGKVSESEAILLREIQQLRLHMDKQAKKMIERIDYLEVGAACAALARAQRVRLPRLSRPPPDPDHAPQEEVHEAHQISLFRFFKRNKKDTGLYHPEHVKPTEYNNKGQARNSRVSKAAGGPTPPAKAQVRPSAVRLPDGQLV